MVDCTTKKAFWSSALSVLEHNIICMITLQVFYYPATCENLIVCYCSSSLIKFVIVHKM